MKVTLWHYFSTVSCAHCDTYITFDFPQSLNAESQFSNHNGISPSYAAKAIVDCRTYSGIDEIHVSYLTEMEKCWQVNLIRQSHFSNL